MTRLLATLAAIVLAYAYGRRVYSQDLRVADKPDPMAGVQPADPWPTQTTWDERHRSWVTYNTAPLTATDRDWLDDTVRTAMGPAT